MSCSKISFDWWLKQFDLGKQLVFDIVPVRGKNRLLVWDMEESFPVGETKSLVEPATLHLLGIHPAPVLSASSLVYTSHVIVNDMASGQQINVDDGFLALRMHINPDWARLIGRRPFDRLLRFQWFETNILSAYEYQVLDGIRLVAWLLVDRARIQCAHAEIRKEEKKVPGACYASRSVLDQLDRSTVGN